MTNISIIFRFDTARFLYFLACSNKFDFKRCPHLCRVQKYTICRYRTNISVLYTQEAEITFSKKPAQESYVYRPKSLWVLTAGTNAAHDWNRLFIPILTIYGMMSPLEFDFWRFFFQFVIEPRAKKPRLQTPRVLTRVQHMNEIAHLMHVCTARPAKMFMQCSHWMQNELRYEATVRVLSTASARFLPQNAIFVFHRNACRSISFWPRVTNKAILESQK